MGQQGPNGAHYLTVGVAALAVEHQGRAFEGGLVAAGIRGGQRVLPILGGEGHRGGGAVAEAVVYHQLHHEVARGVGNQAGRRAVGIAEKNAAAGLLEERPAVGEGVAIGIAGTAGVQKHGLTVDGHAAVGAGIGNGRAIGGGDRNRGGDTVVEAVIGDDLQHKIAAHIGRKGQQHPDGIAEEGAAVGGLL